MLDGKAVAQQIKGTPGITGLSPLSVHSGEEVWHLNIGVLGKRFPTNKSAYNGEPVREELLAASMDQGHTSSWSGVVGATDFYPATPWEVVECKG